MKTGLYAGSFDPITKGHIAVIRQSLNIVDRLYVTVCVNPDKKGMFDMSERVALIRQSINEELAYIDCIRVAIDVVHNTLTVTYAQSVGATILIRGLRNGQDYATVFWLRALKRSSFRRL
jgi:pantetheine-phosphate adenylyltransferase